MTRKQQDILTKAVLAVLLPGLAVGCGLSARFWASWRLLLTWAAGRWCATILLVAAPILEVYLLVRLYYVVKARGRFDRAEALMGSASAVASRRRWKMRGVAAAGGLLVALLVLEGAFRLLGITPDPNPRPQHLDAAAVKNSLNALGIREPWEELDQADPRLRIAFLGDSITYGESVEREETFCHLVEGLVSASCPDGVMTINLGEPGTNPIDQSERYEKLRWSIQPGVLVHVLYPNDLEGVTPHKSLMKIYSIRDDELWFARYSYVLRYVEREIRSRAALRETINFYRGGADSQERREAWEGLKEAVRQVKRMVESHEGRYVIVFHPWLFRLADYPLAKEQEVMREFAREQGVPYLDLMEVYAGREADDLRISPVNEHPNAAAHALLADGIARFLLNEVLDDCDGSGSSPSAPGLNTAPSEARP